MVNQSVFLVECSNFWNVNCASALPHSSASVCFRSVSVCVFLFIFYARISKILKSTGSKNNNFSGLVFKLFNGILMWYFGNHLCKSLTKPNDFIFGIFSRHSKSKCCVWLMNSGMQHRSRAFHRPRIGWFHLASHFYHISFIADGNNNKQ